MDLQPQRKIKPTRRSVSGVHAFRRQRGIPYESTLERDFLIRASLASQKAPATSVLPRDGRSRYSTGQVRRECTVG